MNIEEKLKVFDANGLSKFVMQKGYERTKAGGGSHDTFKHSKTGKVVSIPRHRGDLSPGIVRQVMKQLDENEILDEAGMHYGRALQHLAYANGFDIASTKGDNTIYVKKDSKIVSIPKKDVVKRPEKEEKKKDISDRVVHVKEDAVIKPPERPKKIELGKNRTKVTLNPEKKRLKTESVISRIVSIIKETKADKVGTPYTKEEYDLAYSAPYTILNDPNAPSSLKDLAYRIVQVHNETY